MYCSNISAVDDSHRLANYSESLLSPQSFVCRNRLTKRFRDSGLVLASLDRLRISEAWVMGRLPLVRHPELGSGSILPIGPPLVGRDGP